MSREKGKRGESPLPAVAVVTECYPDAADPTDGALVEVRVVEVRR